MVTHPEVEQVELLVGDDRRVVAVRTFRMSSVTTMSLWYKESGHRADLLRRQMVKRGTHERHDHQRWIAAMEKSIADPARRQDNLMDEREAKTVDNNDEIGRAWGRTVAQSVRRPGEPAANQAGEAWNNSGSSPNVSSPSSRSYSTSCRSSHSSCPTHPTHYSATCTQPANQDPLRPQRPAGHHPRHPARRDPPGHRAAA